MLERCRANVGAISICAVLRSSAQLLAFEPAAASYQTLNESIELNGLDARISAFPIALCAEKNRHAQHGQHPGRQFDARL